MSSCSSFTLLRCRHPRSTEGGDANCQRGFIKLPTCLPACLYIRPPKFHNKRTHTHTTMSESALYFAFLGLYEGNFKLTIQQRRTEGEIKMDRSWSDNETKRNSQQQAARERTHHEAHFKDDTRLFPCFCVWDVGS